MRKLFAVAVKEFRQARRDPLTVMMLIGLPAMMVVLYGYALNFDVRHVPLAVLDRDKSPASRDLVAAFVNSTFFDLKADLPADADILDLLQRGRARAVLEIPERFANDVAARRPVQVQMILDGADANTASAALGYATNIAAAQGVPLKIFRRPIEVRPRVWYNPELKSSHFLVPGLIGFILMITAVISTAMSVVREKERGTLEQIRTTPLGAGVLIFGKTIPYLVFSLAATAVILLSANFLFGVTITGSVWALFVATLVYLLGALGLGLLVSSLASSQAWAFQFGAVISMLPALFLSGFIFPLRSMPTVLQVLSYAVPARYYMNVLRGIILKGADLTPYRQSLTGLGLFALVVLTIAYIRLMRDEVAA